MMRKPLILIFTLCAALSLAISGVALAAKNTINGVVQDASGLPVAKATVWLVPASDVEAMAKGPVEIKRGSANDEPLEDNIAANKGKYKKATTDGKGGFTVKDAGDGSFFLYVEPRDGSYLPGGDMSRAAISAAENAGKRIKILLSGKTPADATYVGTSKCLMCHAGYASEKKTLHKLGISVVGMPSKLQDHSRFPQFNDGLNRLMAGAKFYFHGFDKTRGFDKYHISESMPKDEASASFTATFFKDKDGSLKVRTENLKDPSDPARTYTVEMTYGGGLYKQRYLVRVGRNLFPFVQFNSLGKNEYADRGRKAWRDYHADWFFNEETMKLTDPPKAKSFDKECASCHYTGYTLKKTAEGDYIAGAVNDPNGEADIDADGVPNELNIGCEVCHGPGSAHTKALKAQKASTIVSPGKLASERASMICGQCHSRPQGNLKNDQPVNVENRMMLPGTSRNDFLVDYTTREDAAEKDYWADGLHSKSHHQQYTDFIKSGKYRNGSRLLACADCHDPHGAADIAHQLKAAKEALCAECHKVDMKAHMQEKTGASEMGNILCVDCHATKTMQTGSGLGRGLSNKDGKNYWMNDITSHIFDVPGKDNVGVKGVEPGKAMPIPYTNACGSCHNVEGL